MELYVCLENEIGVVCFTGQHFPFGLPSQGPDHDYYGMPFPPQIFLFSSFFPSYCCNSVLILVVFFVFCAYSLFIRLFLYYVNHINYNV